MTKQPQMLQVSMNKLKWRSEGCPYLNVLWWRVESLFSFLEGAEGQSEWKLQPYARKVAKEPKKLPAGPSSPPSSPPAGVFGPLLASFSAYSCCPWWPSSSSTLRTGRTPAASYSQTWWRAVGSRSKGAFRKDLLEMQTAAALTFLYVSRRRQENHSQKTWKATETSACD